MSRAYAACAACLVLLAACSPAQAEWWCDWWTCLQRDSRANRDWPVPYVFPDRDAVQAPFDQMVANGWRRQNLIGIHHFSDDGSQLTRAGELKVRWILTQAPPQYRTVFVERSLDPADTARRIEAVRQLAARFAAPGNLPDVRETHIVSEGRPAAAVDRAHTQFHESQPVPQLRQAGYGATSSNTP
jgi:hypothetical protein